jgi:hypothetical protein
MPAMWPFAVTSTGGKVRGGLKVIEANKGLNP